MNYTVLPNNAFILHLLSSRRASVHCGQYSFPFLQRVGSRVDLGGWVIYQGGMPNEDGHPSEY